MYTRNREYCLETFLCSTNVCFLLCLPAVSGHPEEGHSRSGGDVGRDGPHLHKLLKQPGPYALVQLRLSFSQNPGFLGQRLGSQDLLHPGIHTQTNKQEEMNKKEHH